MRWLALLLAAPVVLVLVAHVLLVFALPLERVTTRLTTGLGYPVDAGSVTARVLPSPRVRLRDVEIAGAITIAQLEITLQFLPLLRGGLEGGQSRVRGLELSLLRRADGGIEIAGLARKSEQSAEAAEPADSDPTAIPSLPPIRLRDAVIHYVDHTATGGPTTSDVHLSKVEILTRADEDSLDLVAHGRLDASGDEPNLHVEATVGAPAGGKRPIRMSIETQGLDSAPIPQHLPEKWGIRSTEGALDAKIALAWHDPSGFEGELDLHFAPGDLDYAGIRAQDEVVFQAKLHDQGKFRLSDGVLHAERAQVGPLDARQVAARFSHRGDTVTFESLTFESWDGTLAASGTVTVGDPLGFELELDARDLSLYSLQNPHGASPPEDPIRMNVRGPVHGHWIGGDDWLEPIQGQLQISMHGGEVLSGEMLESLVHVLPSRFSEHHDPSQRSAMDTTPLEKLEADFVLESGRARSENLLLVTEDYAIETAGWLEGDGDYSFEGNLTFTPRGLSRLLAAASIRAGPDTRGGMPPCPFAITGNFGSGEFEVQLDDQPLTALVIFPWTMSELTDGTMDVIEAGRSGVDKTVDFFDGLGDEPPDAPSD